ncbi:putative quinol monooxygenase [uncultured Tenacibaculum sp.]|uniref:putative quinol monooxygenase n=1 Tax=uncultured Tenacibaculum sp. TaxID=174713 RepID=UPI00260D04E2|nr:putative quinol monooxygenase [uncultured Tenacibaculum sp.]
MKKIIVAQLNVQKKHEASFLDLAKIMVEKSNKEQGCISYRLHKDIYNQGRYLFYEEYISKTARDFHNNSDHFNWFINNITSLLIEEPIINNY